VLTERLAGWLQRTRDILDALDSATDYDPYEDYRRRLSAIEERLAALEQSGGIRNPANYLQPD